MKSSTDSTFYTICDYLGSIMVVADENGTSKEEYSYDAWGRRRNKDNWTYSSVSAPTYITRGYTGHEHIEEVGLINMNGRVYDPLVGLFLSPDPIVQSPYDVLNYNRYSYVGNNPLKYTDPSGYYKVSEFIKRHGYRWPSDESPNSDMTEYDSFTSGIGGSFEDYNTYCTNAETGDGMWIKNSSMVHREGAEAYKFLVGMLSNPEFSNSSGARSLGQFRGFDEHFFQRDNATGDFYIPYTNEVINPIDFLASLLQADATNGGGWKDGASLSISGAYSSPFKETGSVGFSFGYYRGGKDGGFYFTAMKGKGMMLSLSLEGTYYINTTSDPLQFKTMLGNGESYDVGYSFGGGSLSGATSIDGTPYYGITGSYSPIGLDYGASMWNTYTVPLKIDGTGRYTMLNFLLIRTAFKALINDD